MDMAGQSKPKRFNRRKSIAQLVQQRGFASIDDLARHFRVTPQTIRRDINKLCEDGILRRYHGGAGCLPDEGAGPSAVPLPQQAIAELLARHIPDDCSLFIGLGSTAETVARALTGHKNLRILTNNLKAAQVLSANRSFEVAITGGFLRPDDMLVVGPATLDIINQVKVDYGIISVAGIDEDGALLDSDCQGARVVQAVMKNSRYTLLVAERNALGRSAMIRSGSLGQVDAWFTDATPPRSLTEILATCNTAVHYPSLETCPAD